MARVQVVLFKEDFFPNDQDVDFLRVETTEDSLPIGLVEYAINGIPGEYRVRLDFGGYFYPNDLQEMESIGEITKEQRGVFELVASKIIDTYHNAIQERTTRKKQMVTLLMRLHDTQKQLEEVVMEEKRALIHEEDR